MKYIVEYKMHGKDIPHFIEDGGYFPSKLNGNKLIGMTKESSDTHVPLSMLIQLSNADLISRVVGLNIYDENGGLMNDAAKTEIANKWLSDRGL